MNELNDDVADLQSWRDELTEIDADLAARRNELARLRDSAFELTVLAEGEDAVHPRLLGMSTQDERALRDKLEERAQEREKLTRAAEEAKGRSDTSKAAYEAMQEIDEEDVHAKRRVARAPQIVVSVLLPVAFMVAGIFAFVHGRQINSLSFTVFGIGMVVLAFFLAAASLVVLFRPNKDEEALESRKQDAHWIMLQDKKLLDARMAEKDAFEADLRTLLERNGLTAADGSIRQALLLLDDAKEARVRMAEQRHRAMAHEMHESAASQAVTDLELRRRAVESAADLGLDAPVRTIEARLRECEAERDELESRMEGAAGRIADLASGLEAAKDDRSFDQLKLDYHQIRARLRIAKHDYIKLLLAQRLLS